jgi:hypothetical protein
MHVTQCLVRDGLGWSEQGLINEEGCPSDYEIMGELEYSASKTTALVRFQAHKFPYTSSVYYQCNVKLCIKHAGGCDQVVSSSPSLSPSSPCPFPSLFLFPLFPSPYIHYPLLFQPPVCENGVNLVRRKRQVVELGREDQDTYDLVERQETIKVYSGLYVNEASDLDDDEFASSLDQPDVVS